MKLFIACCLILFNNFQTSFSQNSTYCNTEIYGRFAEQGTLCRYSPTKVGSACGNPGNYFADFGVDNRTQNFILSRHNELRRRVALGLETRGLTGGQPPANNMNKIIRWSNELAAAAQAWANQCQFKADVNRNESMDVVANATSNPVYVGQNMYGYIVRSFLYDRNTTVYWNQAINSWYNEVDVFNPNVVPSYTYQLRAGHYTQMVAASTTLIGCGFMSWGLSRDRVAIVHVCNYGPGGNIPGQPIYGTDGRGCTNSTALSPSKCRDGTTCLNGLCSP